MAKAYSTDLRERVVAAVEKTGMSRRQAPLHFDVGISTVISWARRFRETGSVLPGKMGGHKPKAIGGEHCDQAARSVAARPRLRFLTEPFLIIIRGYGARGTLMHTIKYRLTDEMLSPRRTKLEIPGWAGKPEPRTDGSHEYAWHCVPFSEAAQYGIEVFYPYNNEFRVSNEDGCLVFDGDFGPAPDDGRLWPPFRTFGKNFYTYQLLLDLKVDAGLAIKIEPHPRFYTDPTGSVPIAVPALIRSWWPMMFFLVFKSPDAGGTHVFRPNEPFAQLAVIPEESEFALVEMSLEEAAERELQARRIYESRATLSKDSQWTSASNTAFDATYRRIHGAARKHPPR